MWRYNERKKDENQNTNGGATRMRDSDNNEKNLRWCQKGKHFNLLKKRQKERKAKGQH